MRVLLVRYENESAEILRFIVESRLRAEVTRATSAQEALTILHQQVGFELIIADDRNDSSHEIMSFLKSAGAQIPYILITSKPFPPRNALLNRSFIGCVDRFRLAEELPATIEAAIKNGNLHQGHDESEFCRIKAELLLRVTPLTADIYLKLSNAHFVKLFKSGQEFTFEHFESVRVDKNLTYLYIKRADCNEFLNKIIKDLRVLTEAEGLPGSVAHNMALSTHETLVELTSLLGVTEEVKELVHLNVRLTLKAIGRNPNLAKAIAKLDLHSTRYVSSHSLLVAYTSCSIAALLGWPSETTFNKLTFAAMVHDLSLADSKFAQLGLPEDPARVKQLLSAQDFIVFKNHPVLSANMLRAFGGVPAGADLVVEQHHEQPYGTGYPHGLTASNIAPLSTAFILAHDICDTVFNVGIANFSPKDFLEKNAALYSSGHFKVAAKALRESLPD